MVHNTSKRIGEQLEWGEPIKKRVWQRVVRDKIAHQARLLNARASELESEMLVRLVDEVRSGDTTNREAHAARIYFRALFGSNFSRDDDVPVNAALNYGYGILLSAVNREIVARGYLTQCGICHRSEFNQFNLSCDLMEPFSAYRGSACVRQHRRRFHEGRQIPADRYAQSSRSVSRSVVSRWFGHRPLRAGLLERAE